MSEAPSVAVNENLLIVLQAVIDRRADLDPLSLTSLLTIQLRGCQTLASSSRFGKCLMACLTKYGKKMTAENRTAFSSLVDTHGSNFKPALNAAFKRLNR
ncbi:hypothetical protein PoB_000254700 [Plakobranchus ocellatus]|uniref:Uncharacterized protein n=1 Tax=Plakobranchus ocellatus TaxID=259542 RepID=A0AAV3Y1N4_9GAST|nr:hypothetical protein PoB_000254700 [Plakobranchus ocellatus]